MLPEYLSSELSAVGTKIAWLLGLMAVFPIVFQLFLLFFQYQEEGREQRQSYDSLFTVLVPVAVGIGVLLFLSQRS